MNIESRKQDDVRSATSRSMTSNASTPTSFVDGRRTSSTTSSPSHRRRSSEGSGRSELTLPYDLDAYVDSDLLSDDQLRQWDFPVFELANRAPKQVLSLVGVAGDSI